MVMFNFLLLVCPFFIEICLFLASFPGTPDGIIEICMCKKFPQDIHFLQDENLSRPLPLLIGSPHWNSSSYVGSSEECVEITKVPTCL